MHVMCVCRCDVMGVEVITAKLYFIKLIEITNFRWRASHRVTIGNSSTDFRHIGVLSCSVLSCLPLFLWLPSRKQPQTRGTVEIFFYSCANNSCTQGGSGTWKSKRLPGTLYRFACSNRNRHPEFPACDFCPALADRRRRSSHKRRIFLASSSAPTLALCSATHVS